jgi:hypothetical protein
MKSIVLAIAGGVLIGGFAATHARLPAPPPKSEEQKAAEAQKAAAATARDAELLNKAMDKAVANHKRNQASMGAKR